MSAFTKRILIAVPASMLFSLFIAQGLFEAVLCGIPFGVWAGWSGDFER